MSYLKSITGSLGAMLIAMMLANSTPADAASSDPVAEQIAISTSYRFDDLWQRVQQAVKDNNMGIVGQASASRGAASRGITIPGNAVVGVYRNDFAVRMLQADVPAGIEAPLRLYITENKDGTATLRYRKPSAVFKAYENQTLNEMARELDAIFDKIVRQATGAS
ncbi:MAG: DUF302 domain-containing protein [Proteobacteria bacterium]|nr:DUF302 domain-containing protein [Pseudomonadota bacterium]